MCVELLLSCCLSLCPLPLQVSVLRGQTVNGVVRFAICADKARQRIRLEGASQTSAGIHIAHIQLHRGVVLCGNETARRRALARNVKVDYLALVVFLERE